MIVIFLIFLLLAIFIPNILGLFIGNVDQEDIKNKKTLSTIIRIITLVLALIIFISNVMVVVQAGKVGVITRFGAVQRVISPGLQLKTPFVESVKVVDTRVQKDQVDAEAASKDLQTVKASVALNYRLQAAKVGDLYQAVGLEYKERIIDPAIQEAVKASTARFTAEELITKREEVREDIKIHLKNKLEFRGILVDEFNITNFDFSPSFNQAIEAKVTAEQNALAARNKLEQIKFEAQQAIESAKGKSEAIKIEAAALRDNPQLLELRALERWDGKLPQFMGGSGAVPFININP